MKSKSILGVITAISLSSCASIVSKSDYSVIINSEQKNIGFKVKDSYDRTISEGTTPEIVRLKAGDGYFTKARYNIEYLNKNYPLDAKVDGWYWGNFLFGGILGLFIVDPLTGSMYKMPEEVVLDKKIETPSSKAEENPKDHYEFN